MKKLLSKITFIELTLMFSIAGAVGGVTVPNYVDASQQALMHTKAEMTLHAQDVFSEMTAKGAELPSVAAFAARLPNAAGVVGSGVSLTIDGAEVTLPTYANDLCTVLTQKAEDKVACVGAIPS